MKPSLTVVAETPANETVAAKVKRLQADARALALEHVRQLTRAIAEVEALAADIKDGGDVYPPGVRDLARRIVEDADTKIQTLEAIIGRQS